MKKILLWVKEKWRPLVFGALSMGALAFIMLFQLESLTDSQFSMPEIEAINSAHSLQGIINNPLFLPYKILAFIATKLWPHSVYMLRLPNVILSIGFVILFYLLTKKWFSPFISLITSIMLASSALFLHFARLAVPDILLAISLLALLASAWWLNEARYFKTTLSFISIIIALTLYTPGMVWFIILVFFIRKRHIINYFRRMKISYVPLYLLIGLIVLAPLARAFVLDSSLLLRWLAIPKTFNIADIIKQLIYVPASLTVRTLPNPIFNLGRIPYLDVATIVLAILGTYTYMLRFSLVRTKTLLTALLISWGLIGLGSVSIVLLLPLVYLTVAGGIMVMLGQWKTVFPRNPFARVICLALLLAIVSTSIFYNVSRYFIAWPHNPDTVKAFSLPNPYKSDTILSE